jgi:hypothetical protein
MYLIIWLIVQSHLNVIIAVKKYGKDENQIKSNMKYSVINARFK